MTIANFPAVISDDVWFVDDFEPAPFEPVVCPKCGGTEMEEVIEGSQWFSVEFSDVMDDIERYLVCPVCGTEVREAPRPADDEIPF